ncbi:MAG: beta-lactamase family protein [Flavobacteriales bacterium]|nr:MAG: beta-lactamase family protein [Flavobacteriales bacterium]
MPLRVLLACALLGGSIFAGVLRAQDHAAFADSMRLAHRIPELGYAVVSADSVLELHVLGTKRVDRAWPADEDDRFRIGSNTKTITALIAAQLVHQGKLSWDTRFFDLIPEMRKGARKVYRQLTLRDLLSFRTRLYKYTYTDAEPRREDLTGDEAEQRRQLAAWGFAHKPLHTKDSINFSNLAFVAAGLMLEKASGRSYKQLVGELGAQLGIHFDFGAPNTSDTLQPWGHDAQLVPQPPSTDHKLAWLEAAGNINVSLPEHARFIQELLRGAQGRSPLLPQAGFDDLLFGRSRFALGWWWGVDGQGKRLAWHQGNPGSFLSVVYVHADVDRAYIVFANVQSDDAAEGMRVLYDTLSADPGQ